jgi:adenosylhomocysteine nucleosidase
MARIAIVAAMFREVHPLVRKWDPKRYLPDRRVQLYVSDGAVVAYAGMGRECAEVACKAALAVGEVDTLISVGWAGGLNRNSSAGQVVQPEIVVDALSGKRYKAGGTQGTLVSVQLVADTEEKRRLAERYRADFVDMEAAAVAHFAQEAGLPFLALKAISDAHDARLPDMNRFNRKGRFQSWKFLAYMAVRPMLWQLIADMSRASLESRDELCKQLLQMIAERSEVATAGKPENQTPQHQEERR